MVYLTRTAAGQTVTSYSATKASIDALGVNAATLGGVAATAYQPRGETLLATSGTGTTLVADAAALRLRGLAVAGGGLSLDASNPAVVTLSAAAPPTLADETGVPATPASYSLVGATSGAGNTLRTKKLVAGAGIAVTETGNTLTVENTQTSAGVTLASAGGAVSLVNDGTGPSLAVKGLAAGYATGLVDNGSTAVTVRSNAVESVPLRPADVVAASGQCRVVAAGVPLDLSAWPIDPDLAALIALPAVRYRASAAASHQGSFCVAVHGLPANAAAHGWRLQFTVQAAKNTAAASLDVQVTVPWAHAVIPNVWDQQSFTGTLTTAAFATDGTAAPAQVREVALTPVNPRGAAATVACVDGATLPYLARLNGQTMHASPTLFVVRLSGSAALAADLDIVGAVLRLVPATST